MSRSCCLEGVYLVLLITLGLQASPALASARARSPRSAKATSKPAGKDAAAQTAAAAPAPDPKPNTKPDTKEDRATQKARVKAAAGEAALNQKHPVEALQLFQQAYELKPLPEFLLRIAQCHRGMGNAGRAAFSYRQYLKNAGNIPNRIEVEELAAVMEALADAVRGHDQEIK